MSTSEMPSGHAVQPREALRGEELRVLREVQPMRGPEIQEMPAGKLHARVPLSTGQRSLGAMSFGSST